MLIFLWSDNGRLLHAKYPGSADCSLLNRVLSWPICRLSMSAPGQRRWISAYRLMASVPHIGWPHTCFPFTSRATLARIWDGFRYRQKNWAIPEMDLADICTAATCPFDNGMGGRTCILKSMPMPLASASSERRNGVSPLAGSIRRFTYDPFEWRCSSTIHSATSSRDAF